MAAKAASQGKRCHVTAAQRMRHGFVRHPARPIKLAERPKHIREVGHGSNADVLPEAESQRAITLCIVSRHRLLKMRPRAYVVSLKIAGQAQDPIRDTRLRGCRAALG